VVLLPLLVAGCSGDEPPPVTNFPALDYGYLLKLRLNVGSVDVEDHSVPFGDADMAGQAPTPPAQALARMAHERLFAAGLSGQAIFTIDQASIVRGPSGALDGQLAVHLQLFNAAGQPAGYAAARVARQYVPGTDDDNLRAILNDMTKKMMDDMNVEVEFQVRKSLGSFLMSNTAVPAPVTATPLQPAVPQPAPGPDRSIPGMVIAPPPVAAPPQDPAPYGDSAAPPAPDPPPQQLSPPPGYLQLPPGTPPI